MEGEVENSVSKKDRSWGKFYRKQEEMQSMVHTGRIRHCPEKQHLFHSDRR